MPLPYILVAACPRLDIPGKEAGHASVPLIAVRPSHLKVVCVRRLDDTRVPAPLLLPEGSLLARRMLASPEGHDVASRRAQGHGTASEAREENPPEEAALDLHKAAALKFLVTSHRAVPYLSQNATALFHTGRA